MAFVTLIAVGTFDLAVGQVGVCYGKLDNNLPLAPEVVALFYHNNIRRMRIYGPDQETLRALSCSSIELTLSILNSDLQYIDGSQSNANEWVQSNVRNYPNVRFRYIAVENEVSPANSYTAMFASSVLPAMRNIRNAILAAGLSTKFSTTVKTGLLGNSYPPADGSFRSNVASYINPIVQFLANTNAPLLVNIYPYFSYISNQVQISLPYALFASDGNIVPSGMRYQNLLYVILDAMYAAVEKTGGGFVKIVVSDTEWPSVGGVAATINNARTYNTNLVQWVKSGTQKRPGRAIETYICAMFDENQKNPEYEKHWGIFQANK